MSPELKQFYVEMQEWIDEGCPPHRAFYRGYGLCTNLVEWMPQSISGWDSGLLEEQHELFVKMGLDRNTPFNFGEVHLYHSEVDYLPENFANRYLNPLRLFWIEVMAA